MTEVAFRPARPDDVESAVPLIHASGPKAFGYVFGRHDRHAEAFLRHAWLDGDGEFGWRTHTVGTLDGRVVAVGAAFVGDSAGAWLGAAVRQIVGVYGPATGAGVMARGLRAERVIRPPGRREWYLAHLGVDEGYRGRGVGTKLVEHLLSSAPSVAEASLHVAEVNPRAQALYERLGFEVTGERGPGPSNEFGSVVVHRRMARPL